MKIKNYFIYITLLGVIMLNIKSFLFVSIVLTFIYMYDAIKEVDKRVARSKEFNEYLEEEGRLN